jgi:hypothetical protein
MYHGDHVVGMSYVSELRPSTGLLFIPQAVNVPGES